jgi:cystathionine beta-synthase
MHFVITDKQSKKKDILRVAVLKWSCPTDVEPTDETFILFCFKRLGTEIPNSWYVNQYDNPQMLKHITDETGPEIWEQTDGRYICCGVEPVEPFLVLGVC